jgi:hypothetical protein
MVAYAIAKNGLATERARRQEHPAKLDNGIQGVPTAGVTARQAQSPVRLIRSA